MVLRIDPDDLTALLSAVRERENGAFERLLDLYRPLLVSTVASFGDDDGVMMQEATIALYHAACKYREGRGTTFGLFAAICVKNALRSTLRRMGKPIDAPIDETVVEGEALDPESTLITAETVRAFFTLCAELLSPFEFRVVTRRLDGFSNREIADQLGKSEKSVSNAIGRGVKKIRERLPDFLS